MTSFAPGTNQDYANAVNNWWFNNNGQGPPPQRSAFGPDSPPGPATQQTRTMTGDGGFQAYRPQGSGATSPFSAYSPGQAQPMQPQSQGTRYGQQGGPYAAYGPQQISQQPAFTPGGGPGNLAYAPPGQRPQPFTTSIRGPDGNQYDPGQFFPMRDAFIQNINDARSSFAANPSAGPPQMDFGGMWNRAGDMASQGYQNPMAGMFGGAPQAPSAGAAPQADAIRSLFAQNNIQAPQGFMDQLLGMLGPQAPPQQLGGLAPPRPSAYDSFLQNYNSGAPLGDPIWETRRRMGQAAPAQSFWQSTNTMPQQIAGEQAAARQTNSERQRYLEAETARRVNADAVTRQAAPQQPLPPAFSGRESPAQQAMRGQLLHGVQRDAILNGWQFKNMLPEERKAEVRRREAAIMAASPQEIARMHQQSGYPEVGKSAQGGYRAVKPRYQD
jgi:hypothetical protein